MVTIVLQIVSMGNKFIEMAKSLVARIFAVALVMSLIAGGLSHAEVPSCLLLPHSARTLDSGIDQLATVKITKMSKELGGAIMGHATKDRGSQNKLQCCDNWCPLLFMTSGQSTASGLIFRSVHALVPQGSLLTAYGKGLERPPKTLFTY